MKRLSLLLLAAVVSRGDPPATQVRIGLKPSMVVNESDVGAPGGLVDEQDRIIGTPVGDPGSTWAINSKSWKQFPYSAYLDLGSARNLSVLWIYDTNGDGDVVVSHGSPGTWTEVATYDCKQYKKWVSIPLDVTTRYLRFTRRTPGANFSEIALYEHTPEAHEAMLARKAAEAKEKAERDAALQRAMEEMKKRPLVDVGPPFGELPLIDEIDCGLPTPDHGFAEDPAGVSRVETILGRPCRVLNKTEGEAAYISFRIGKMKLLTPGAAYVLAVEFPEDAPRSLLILNGGNETIRGLHTGTTFGDALHAKYVSSNSESLSVPLSGRHETWTMLFNLHDRFPDRTFIRGSGPRELTPEDGFDVTIAQFSARNIPASQGAAVSRIRLFAVPEPGRLKAVYRPPPTGLPRRHIFWREEMADGVITGRKETKRGIVNWLDWYRYKANVMDFLAMDTYGKDLLEFGACQHWDPSEGGGNAWVHFNGELKHLWGEIVAMMGERGFSLLPYYEYAGSRGDKSLGYQKRAKPLTRDDAYTHIKWIENANADLTDPDTHADFKKMLDLTVLRHRHKATFLGVWLRPRGQMPMGFGDATRERFAREANGGGPVSRKQLIDDKDLLARYYDWWYGKRREFFEAMRDHLRQNGIDDATVLCTPLTAESGVSFPTWEKRIVTDDPEFWREVLGRPLHVLDGKRITPVSIEDVLAGGMYREALTASALNWGTWEAHHSNPPADPVRYRDTEGVLFTHCINRAYTASDPSTFDLFRGPSGLAVMRHFPLNEHMTYDTNDKPKLGYFIADIERAGPYCLLAEARAVAYGDATLLGYLVGLTYNRGFPEYVRRFNTAFLSLPALPSHVVDAATADTEVIVRAIPTPEHGTYLAVVNVGMEAKEGVSIRLPKPGRVTDAPTGAELAPNARSLTLSLYPCELRALRLQ